MPSACPIAWPSVAPERTFIARARHADDSSSDWLYLSYVEGSRRARNIAQTLINEGLGANLSVVILIDNSFDACTDGARRLDGGYALYTGVARLLTISQDFDTLRHVFDNGPPRV